MSYLMGRAIDAESCNECQKGLDGWPHIETAEDYARYEAAVDAGLEGLEYAGTGYPECPDCFGKWSDEGRCVDCDAEREMVEEPGFSWRPCDVCRRQLGGDRYKANAWPDMTGKSDAERLDQCRQGPLSLSICSDCLYYLEYGHLDDETMMRIGR